MQSRCYHGCSAHTRSIATIIRYLIVVATTGTIIYYNNSDIHHAINTANIQSEMIVGLVAVNAFVHPVVVVHTTSKKICNHHHEQCITTRTTQQQQRRFHHTFMVQGSSSSDAKTNAAGKKTSKQQTKNKSPSHNNSSIKSTHKNTNNNDNSRKKKQSKTTKKKFHKKNNFHNNNSKELIQAKAINKELIQSTSATQVLDIFISKGGAKGIAGGGVFNSVNYSTFMHRLARFATFVDYSKLKNKNEPTTDEKRKMILSDPRTAILIASLAEALVQNSNSNNNHTMLIFNNRELANLGWAVAKLKLAPPSNVYPITRLDYAKSSNNSSNSNKNVKVLYVSLQEAMEDDLLQTATTVRQQVLAVAKERSMSPKGVMVKSKWIPTLSQLCGKLLDSIAARVLNILDKFNSQELANLLYAFASAGRADVYFFDQLATQLVRKMKISPGNQKNLQPKPQEFSNSIWAFASAGIRCEGQRELIKCVADTMNESNGKIVNQFKPQELSNTAWGVGTLISRRDSDTLAKDVQIEDQSALHILRWVAKSLKERVEDFKPQEISNSAWAFATLGFGATPIMGQFNTNNEYISLLTDQPDEDRKLVTETMLVVAKNAITRLHRFRPQELNNLVWSFCRLGQENKEMRLLLEGVGQELLKRSRYFAPQDIGTTLWSFATLEYYNEDVFKQAASELTLTKSPSFKPQELSNTVWALATAGAVPKYIQAFDTTTVKSNHRVSRNQIMSDPITACFAAATTELMRRPQEFKEQEIKDVLWALSKAGIRHPLVFKKVAEHLVGTSDGNGGRGFNGFSTQGLGNLAWSYAKQAQLAEGGSESKIGSSGRLAVYEAISMDVGGNLIRQLFSGIAEAALNTSSGLTKFKPQDLSNTCWAFATLGLKHTQFFHAVGDQVEQRLANFKPRDADNLLVKFKAQEIANLVWSFATLDHKTQPIMDYFADYIIYICSDQRKKTYDERSIAQCFKRQEIANIAWSCTILEQYPKQLMTLLYAALFGVNDTHPKSLATIYGDVGLQRQAIMTMFYVQMALDIEEPDLGLSLPPNFPFDWKETHDTTSYMLNDDEERLQLTTSRLQKTVSKALSRIEFDHVQEHIISTNDIQVDHGITLSDENQEFLSIDIADVENMIGIEVDGPGHFITVLDDDSDDGSQTVPSDHDSRRGILASTNQQVNGPTAMKDRLLQHLGWSIIHIPFWEWRDLKDDEEAEEEYIESLLQNVQ